MKKIRSYFSRTLSKVSFHSNFRSFCFHFSYLLEDSVFVQPCLADPNVEDAEEGGSRSGSQARPDILTFLKFESSLLVLVKCERSLLVLVKLEWLLLVLKVERLLLVLKVDRLLSLFAEKIRCSVGVGVGVGDGERDRSKCFGEWDG